MANSTPENTGRMHEKVEIPKGLTVPLQAGDQVVLGHLEATLGVLRVTLSGLVEFTALGPVKTYDLTEAIQCSPGGIADIRAQEDSMTGFLRYARIERRGQAYILVAHTDGVSLQTTLTSSLLPVHTSGWVVPERRLEPGDVETLPPSRTPQCILDAAIAPTGQTNSDGQK